MPTTSVGNQTLVTEANSATISSTCTTISGTVTTLSTTATDIKTAVQLIDDTVGTDGAAAPAKAIQIGVDDGTNIRNTKGGPDGAVYVNQNNLLPGEDAVNDERSVRIKTLGTGNSSTLGTAVDDAGGGDIGDVILASTEVLGYSRVAVEVDNAGGGSGDDLDRIIIFASVSGTGWDPIHDSGTGLAWSPADDAYIVLIENNGYRYIKAEALCDTGEDTTADCYWCGNKG